MVIVGFADRFLNAVLCDVDDTVNHVPPLRSFLNQNLYHLKVRHSYEFCTLSKRGRSIVGTVSSLHFQKSVSLD